MNSALIIIASLGYVGLLFFIAWAIERYLKRKRSLPFGGSMYALSLAVYCTGWTYYGSVGRAATHGLEFITIYLGPLITCALFVPVVRKILRICKTQRINSIADFISTRYGKNVSLGVIVTLCCIFGVIPYIALQLKAISGSFHLITARSDLSAKGFWLDDSFYITVVLALFVIVFGTRRIDVSERHEGLVGAIAFESVIKLLAFVIAGIFITYYLFNGFGDLFDRVSEAGLKQFFTLNYDNGGYSNWFSMVLVSMLAMILLPRQFQVSIVENTSEKHLYKAVWLFPLYLFVINIFVLPIAMAGQLSFGTAEGADSYVLSLPMHYGHSGISLLVFLGGFSAGTGMIMVETIALSTMVSNHLVLPVLLRNRPIGDSPLKRLVLRARRGSILIILLLAYLYDGFIAPSFSLVSIGLISMAAVAQLAPVMAGALYWKGTSRKGAVAGIVSGFIIWFYTLIIPSAVDAGYLGRELLTDGPWGIGALRPQALFGLEGFSLLAHSLFWSLLMNTACFAIGSINSKLSPQELYGAEVFTRIFQDPDRDPVWVGRVVMRDVSTMLESFIGAERSANLIQSYAQRHRISLDHTDADPRMVEFAERILSGVIGSASSRFMISSITKEEEIRMEEVLSIVRESQQALELNKELKKKSIELTRAKEALTRANDQLREIDGMKDEFLYTVTHELRTPLTSIRAMSEIIYDNPEMTEDQRQMYLEGIVRETERLTHLITQVLNLERYESGRQKLQLRAVDIGVLLHDVAESLAGLAIERGAEIRLEIPNEQIIHQCDREMLYQAVYNLVANALKFVPKNEGLIRILARPSYDELQLWVMDNGKGIDHDVRELIFDKFFQARNQTLQKPAGSGLGLAICKRITELHDGRIWVESEPGHGARFAIALPRE